MTASRKAAPTGSPSHPTIAPIALDIAGAAKLLGVSERLLYGLRARQDFPRARELSTGVKRYIVNELIAWLVEQPVAQITPEPAQLSARRFRDGKLVNGREAQQ